MKTTVIHHREASGSLNEVYIGRPSKWGNPFHIGVDGSRSQVISKFRDYLNSNPTLRADVEKELRGKVLVCWCSPKACHGDVLAEIANQSRGRVRLF